MIIAVGGERPWPADLCRRDVESQVESNLGELLESLVVQSVAGINKLLHYNKRKQGFLAKK